MLTPLNKHPLVVGFEAVPAAVLEPLELLGRQCRRIHVDIGLFDELLQLALVLDGGADPRLDHLRGFGCAAADEVADLEGHGVIDEHGLIHGRSPFGL